MQMKSLTSERYEQQYQLSGRENYIFQVKQQFFWGAEQRQAMSDKKIKKETKRFQALLNLNRSRQLASQWLPANRVVLFFQPRRIM